MPASITLPDLLDAHADRYHENNHISLPCKVLSYDAASQTVVAQPLIKRPGEDANGDTKYEALPAYPNIQVAFPRAGSFVVYLPIAAGSYGHLVFIDMANGEARATGQLSEPKDTERHSGGYCFFLPGGYPDSSKLTDHPSHGYIGLDGDQAQAHFTTGSIKLGASATDFVALASLVAAQLNTLKTAISSAPVVPTDGGAAFKAGLVAALAAWPASVAATVTKAQ